MALFQVVDFVVFAHLTGLLDKLIGDPFELT